MEQPGNRRPAPEPLGLIQDLANSFDLESGRESLFTPADLDALVRLHGIATTGFTLDDLERTRLFRDLLRDACIVNAGHDAAPGSAASLNAVFSSVPMALVMAPGGAPSLARAASMSRFESLVVHAQDSIYRGSVLGIWSRLKACQSETCRWVYYDSSPSGHSRWCTMSVCGARAKMRAYRARR